MAPIDLGTDRHRYSRTLLVGSTCHEQLAALIDEDAGPLDPVSLLLALQLLETVDLIPLQVMDAVGAALEPTDDDGPLRRVDVIPAQVTSLGDAQTVPVDNQSDQPIPVTVPIALERRQQLVNLGLDKVIPDPAGIVPRRPFELLVALRCFLACRSWTILPDISAIPMID